MIDVENQIITDVINGFVGTDYADINIASDPPQKAVFPYVLFYQSDAWVGVHKVQFISDF